MHKDARRAGLAVTAGGGAAGSALQSSVGTGGDLLGSATTSTSA